MSAETILHRESFRRDVRPVPVFLTPRINGVTVEPPLKPKPGERAFGLHPAVFGMMGGGFVAYLGLMTATFGAGHGMPVLLAICAVCLIGYFGVPLAFSRVRTGERRRAKSFSGFMAEGVQTATGRLTGGATLAQVLIMPALLVLWGVAVLVIKSITL